MPPNSKSRRNGGDAEQENNHDGRRRSDQDALRPPAPGVLRPVEAAGRLASPPWESRFHEWIPAPPWDQAEMLPARAVRNSVSDRGCSECRPARRGTLPSALAGASSAQRCGGRRGAAPAAEVTPLPPEEVPQLKQAKSIRDPSAKPVSSGV